MEVEEVKKQIKNYVDDKKNPYFGSVIAVWIITNRVLIFGLFNFDNDFSFDRKMSWVHQQFNSFKKLDFLWGFQGFYATIIWSLLWGYIVMIIFNKVNGFGKVVYKLVNRGTINLYQWVEPTQWKSLKEYQKKENEAKGYEEEVNAKRAEFSRVQKENESLNQLYMQSEKGKIEANTKNGTLEGQIQQHIAEKNRLRILYANYGVNEINKFFEVTKAVSTLIAKEGKFNVENDVLGGDPIRCRVKSLYIEYEVNQEVKTVIVDESAIVELKNNELVMIVTERSRLKQSWIQYTNRISEIFKDEWNLTYVKDGKSDSETVKIDNGKYYGNGEHTFNILVFTLNEGLIELKKISLNGVEHSKEKLNIINDKLITGNDNIGYELRYTKPIIIGKGRLVRK